MPVSLRSLLAEVAGYERNVQDVHHTVGVEVRQGIVGVQVAGYDGQVEDVDEIVLVQVSGQEGDGAHAGGGGVRGRGAGMESCGAGRGHCRQVAGTTHCDGFAAIHGESAFRIGGCLRPADGGDGGPAMVAASLQDDHTRDTVGQDFHDAALSGVCDGMATVGGQGDVGQDDVSDPRSLEEIRSTDLQPFIELASGLDSLMIAHVVYPEVDFLPAGYSQTWLQDVLRTELGYRGVIFSDDLGMHAAKAVGGLVERTRLCLNAGCDLVLVCQPEDVASLLADLDGPVGDATTAITGLYGRPTVNRKELVDVDREGIREWRHWRQSLEDLGEQSWG